MYLKLIEEQGIGPGSGVTIMSLCYDTRRERGQDKQNSRQIYLKRILDAMKTALGGESGISAFKNFSKYSEGFDDEDIQLACYAYLAAEQLSVEEKQNRTQAITNTINNHLWPMDDDNIFIQQRLAGMRGGIEDIFFMFPTDCLDVETKTIAARLLERAAQYQNLDDSDDPGMFLIYANRQSLFIDGFQTVAGNDGKDSPLAQFVCETILKFLPHGMLKNLGEAVARISQHEQQHQVRIEYLKQEIPSDGWFSYSRAFALALHILLEGNEDDFKNEAANLKAGAKSDYDLHYANRLRVIHWMIR